MKSSLQCHSRIPVPWCRAVKLAFVFLVSVLLLPSNLEAQRLNPRKYFDGQVSSSLERAKEISQSSGKPVFAVIYEPMADRRPGMRENGGGNDWALGYFTQNTQTREILKEHFVTALVTVKQPGVSEILGNTVPSMPWVVVFAPDGAILEKREVYTDPEEGQKIVAGILDKWNSHIPRVGSEDQSEGAPPPSVETTSSTDKIAVNPHPTGMNRAGMLPVEDFVNLLAPVVSADPSGQVAERFSIYGKAPIFATVDEAIELLDIPRKVVGRHEVTVAGWPEKSFFFRSYDIDQKSNDGFNKLTLVTDYSDRLVSIIFLDESPTSSIPTPENLKSWHTFDFVHNKRKMMTTYLIHHEVKGANGHVLQIDSSAFIPSRTEAGVSRHVDRARWYLPKTLAALILEYSERLLAESRR